MSSIVPSTQLQVINRIKDKLYDLLTKLVKVKKVRNAMFYMSLYKA